MAVTMKVTGVDQWRRGFDQIGDRAHGALEDIAESAAEQVAAAARKRVPSQTGRARASIKVSGADITAGGPRAPYYGWLDYGGLAGPYRSISRPYRAQGRYLYPAHGDTHAEIRRELEAGYAQVVTQAGFRVG